MDYPVAYLFRVGKSAAKKYRKQRTLVSRPEESEHWVEPGLIPALGRLTDRQRTAVVLRHAFGYDLSAISEVMGVAIPTVQKHVERGLAKLRGYLVVGERP